MQSTATLASHSPPEPGGAALFWAFSEMALSGFGGVLPFAYRCLVEKRGWLSPTEFAGFLGMSQMLPGPTICNVALMVGHKFGGTRGALAALAGLIVFPFFLVIGLGALYQRYGELPAVREALHGMSAMAAGLILATTVKMGVAMYRKPEGGQDRAAQAGLCLLAFIGMGLCRWSLIWVFVPLAVAGTLFFYSRRSDR